MHQVGFHYTDTDVSSRTVGTLKMEPTVCTETSVNHDQSTPRNINHTYITTASTLFVTCYTTVGIAGSEQLQRCEQAQCFLCALTFWRLNYFFLILAHPVCKMWIIQEPNTLELWNKLHFEEKKNESIYRV